MVQKWYETVRFGLNKLNQVGQVGSVNDASRSRPNNQSQHWTQMPARWLEWKPAVVAWRMVVKVRVVESKAVSMPMATAWRREMTKIRLERFVGDNGGTLKGSRRMEERRRMKELAVCSHILKHHTSVHIYQVVKWLVRYHSYGDLLLYFNAKCDV